MNHQQKGETMEEGKKNGEQYAYPGRECSGTLTKREYFAAMAMQGLCAHPKYGDMDSSKLASYSAQQADALLAELAKTEVGG